MQETIWERNRQASKAIAELEALLESKDNVLTPCTVCDCEYYDETDDEFCGGEISSEPAICSCKKYADAKKAINTATDYYLLMILKGYLSHFWIDINHEQPKKFAEYLCVSMYDNCPVHLPYIARYDPESKTWYKHGTSCVPSHWMNTPATPILTGVVK